MEVLVSSNKSFNLNQPSNSLLDEKFCVFDYSDKDDKDFYFKRVSKYFSYRNAVAELKIGNYYLDLPLNWKVLVTNTYDYMCNLVSIEDLLHYPHKTAIFNPYYYCVPKIVNISINNINFKPIEHFVPYLSKKNVLVLPLGHKKDYPNKIKDDNDNVIDTYPDCILACDDVNNTKFEFDLYNDIIE